MYCPKCSNPATEGQRFCRQCGTNLGAIVDAMEGRRGPVDFERLKVDLKDLGTSLRTGFEQAHKEFKKTQHFSRRQYEKKQRHGEDLGAEITANIANDIASSSSCVATNATSAGFDAYPKPKRSRESRRYHLQKGILSIFSGGAVTGAYYLFLKTATESGLLASLERLVLQHNPDLTGLLPVVQMLWIFGLIPVATGLGHLINGAFFAPSDKELKELYAAQAALQADANRVVQPPPFISSEPKVTNEFHPDAAAGFSVTEDATLPLGQREPKRQAS